MSAMEELDIGMVQVGHSYTEVVEYKNSGVNLLSCGTSNPGKQVSSAKNTGHISKRFMLGAHKL